MLRQSNPVSTKTEMAYTRPMAYTHCVKSGHFTNFSGAKIL